MIVSKAAKHDLRLRWFDEARFGMFIHFGLYALLGRGEWVMYHEQIPRDEYETLAARFNPKRFDADEWVALARDAGARYITVTAKHHDGFCLFDSALTDYKITNTPFGRDLIGELIAACHRADMRICLYYSQPDWHHPNFVHQPGAFKDLDHPPADQQPDRDRYLEYYIGQVRELCSNYGRIDGIWFDGSHKSEADWCGRRVYRMIKKLQPTAVVNERARHGDFFTPERRLPDDLTGYLFEACQSVSTEAWGYRGETTLFSTRYLIESLVRMAGRGGNYLLNVGPHPDGHIPEDQAQRMRAIGDWLKRNGQAVYGTQGFALAADKAPCATQRGRDLYVLLPRWPDTDRVTLDGLRSLPEKAVLLHDRKRICCERGRDGIVLRGLPPNAPETTVNVIKLTFAEPPKPRRPRRRPAPVITVDAENPTTLAAETARVDGRGPKGTRLRLTPSSDRPGAPACLSDWKAPEQRAIWTGACARSGRYEVSVSVRCSRQRAGSSYVVRSAGQAIEGTVRATPHGAFRRQRVGVLHLKSGRLQVTLQATRLTWGYVFADIRDLRLKPLD